MQSGEATPPFDEPDGHQTGQGMVSLPSDQGEGKRKTVHQTALTGTSFGLEDVKRTLQQRGEGQPRVSKGSRKNAPATSRGGRSMPSIARQSSGMQYTPATNSYLNDDRRQAASFALKLLSLCKCSRCGQIIRDPVTLPCSHSACLTCIIIMTSASRSPSTSQILPSTSLLPPRLPLSSTTVPCPVSGCPRSAIGQGMGIWSGHKAIYGTSSPTDMLDWPTADDVSQGKPGPLDGFVAPQNQESNRLVVIPAQSRNTITEKYAITKYTLDGVSMSEESGLLRPDVTLSKALELLRQYSQFSFEPRASPTLRRLPLRTATRTESTVRQRRARRSRASRRDNTPEVVDSCTALYHHPAGTRTEINPHFLSTLGVSEEGMDTGAVGGVQAALDSGGEEEPPDDCPDSAPCTSWSMGGLEDADEWIETEDDHDEEIGGAFARHYGSSPDSMKQDGVNTFQKLASTSPPKSNPAIQTPESLHCELLDVLECQLCYMLLYQPLTTPCGHTFCRHCFARSLDHSSTCPLCRADMPSFAYFQAHPSNEIILNLLTATWQEADEDGDDGDYSMSPSPTHNKSQQFGLKQMYKERQIAMDKEASESLLSTPLFVCTLAFPFMPTILHIFEPRYRLMIRRCLESGYARFGMVLNSTETSGPVPGMSRYGTMLEIKTVQMLADGRSMIETVGSHRFRVLERGSLDGYTVGQIERIDDVAPEQEDEVERASLGLVDPDSPASVLAEAREAQAAFQAAIGIDLSRGEEQQQQASNMFDTFAQRNTTQLVEVCTDFIETLQSGSAPWLMTRLNNTYGPMPEASNVAAFGYWMALVMPIDEHEKARLLPIRSPRLRLRIVVHWIEQLRQTWWFNHGCSVQ